MFSYFLQKYNSFMQSSTLINNLKSSGITTLGPQIQLDSHSIQLDLSTWKPFPWIYVSVNLTPLDLKICEIRRFKYHIRWVKCPFHAVLYQMRRECTTKNPKLNCSNLSNYTQTSSRISEYLFKDYYLKIYFYSGY